MNDPYNRTKVVIRHLPPSLSQSTFFDQIDARFSGRYNWFCFRPGNNSQKHQRYSRAYIDFKRSEDVFQFAELFDGHAFVNEKGAQFKTIVEYAPLQHVPKPCSKKDGREGTIYKDSNYLEFLELISKPVENLPSAEIQLERREAEQAGAAKETPIVTPLMDFVRQKRAAEGGTQRSSANGKVSRRARAASAGKHGSTTAKRGSEKKKYILRDSAKNTSGKDKSTFIVVARRGDNLAASSGKEILENESGITVSADSGKKKFLLLKGKEREISHVSESMLQQQGVMSPVGTSPVPTASKQSQRRGASGRLIRGILLNKEARHSQSSVAVQSQQKNITLNLENGKRLPRSINMCLGLNGHVSNIEQPAFSFDGDTKRALDYNFVKNDLHGLGTFSERQEKRTRNKDRPDRGVWTTLRRSDVSHASDEQSLSSVSQPTKLVSDSLEGTATTMCGCSGVGKSMDGVLEDRDSGNRSTSCGNSQYVNAAVYSACVGNTINSFSAYDPPVSQGEIKGDMPNASSNGEDKAPASGRISSSVENGSHRHFGRRGPAQIMKDDGSLLTISEGKYSKRGGGTSYGSHEKQVWVQKSFLGS